MDTTTQATTLLVILVVFAANAIVPRRRNYRQRPITAIGLIKRLVGDSIESNKPLHLSFGNAGVGERETLLALVSADFLYTSAKDVALGDTAPIVTVGNSSTIQVARDMLRRAHRDGLASQEYRPFNVRWYPVGTQFGLVAAASAMNADDQLSSHLLTGNYGAELGLLLWGSERHRIETLVGSTQIDGQAVAFASANGYLLGEEIFAAASYTQNNPALTIRNVIFDLVRWLLILTLIILFIVNLAGRN